MLAEKLKMKKRSFATHITTDREILNYVPSFFLHQSADKFSPHTKLFLVYTALCPIPNLLYNVFSNI